MGRHSDSDDSDENISHDSKDESESSDEDRQRSKQGKSKKSKHCSSHKKRSKDKKKSKKKSKKHHKRSSSSESNSSDEEEWVVKTEPVPAKRPQTDIGADISNEGDSKKPKLQPVANTSKVSLEQETDEWANFTDIMPTFSNESKRSERRKQREEERESSSIDKLGKHVNELNPYWKDGGTGLPEEKSESGPKESSSSQMIGDGGLNYLRKAFARAKEQAAEEGRSVEDIISERWGSLERFLGMLEEAENKVKKNSREERAPHSSKCIRFIRPDRESDDEDNAKYSRHGGRSSRHNDYSHRERNRRRSKERESGWRKQSSPERSRYRGRDVEDNRRRRDSPEYNRQRRDSPEDSRKKRASPEITRRIRDSTDTNCKNSNALTEVLSRPDTNSDDFKLKPQASESNKPLTTTQDCHSLETTDSKPSDEGKSVLTDKEMNELNAKLLKAEIFGNTSLMDELKQKITEAELSRANFVKNGGDILNPGSSIKVVTKVIVDDPRDRGRRKDKVTETHKDGQRVRYFPDDDKYTLKNMFQREKMNTAADENALFARLAGKGAKTGQDYDIDDVFTDKASSSKQSSKEQEKEIRDVLENEKHYKKILDSCSWCFDGSVMEKHLILSVAEKCYLCVPPYQSMTVGHCLIVPMSYVSCSTDLDEDVWAEMQKFRKALVTMFREMDQDMVIFETALFLKRHPHMYLECIPMPKETGELAPIYFKKAIQECETEWSQNKKLVDLRNRDVRRAIPKSLPYFSVDFGDDNCGFAHVVEDERNFPRNFSHEIVGGMLELDHHLWRKQKKDDFRTQRNKVMEFLKMWGPHDWTREAN